jgi:DNA-binding NtrC family response regulator
MAVRILLFTPDPEVQRLLAAALRPDFSVALESSRTQLFQNIASCSPDVVLLDYDSNHARKEDLLELCGEISDASLPVVVMTDDMRRSTAIEFWQRGAFDCIRKPPVLGEIKVVVRRAYEHAMMASEMQRLRDQVNVSQGFGRLVGSSGRAQVVYDLIRRVASLNANVLITGESGTGKELVARAIHEQGNRSSEPFVPVSCGAIPESLIEAELFGHEKGAYTGSNGPRAGYLERAAGGTLFLDEIGELSLGTQVKLLRVLQEREFCRLGGTKPTPLKARILFATHRNLQQMVDAGTFRQDLFFRVNVMTIRVPALRDRTEDIPLLAHHFLTHYAEEYGKPVNDIRPNAMELLVQYDWPGNIRELENVIQGAMILADGESLTRADLPDHFREFEESSSSEDAVLETGDDQGFEDLLRQFKVALATKAIDQCKGNKSLAARKLRVSRAYLHRLIRMAPRTQTTDVA